MLRFDGEYFIYLLASCQISFSNLLMTSSPEEPTLSIFQKPFNLSRNVSVSCPFSSIAQRMDWVSNTREHEICCSLEMDQLDLLL